VAVASTARRSLGEGLRIAQGQGDGIDQEDQVPPGFKIEVYGTIASRERYDNADGGASIPLSDKSGIQLPKLTVVPSLSESGEKSE
jgi:hypothetical protein